MVDFSRCRGSIQHIKIPQSTPAKRQGNVMLMFTLFSSDGICGTGKQVFPSSRHVLVVEDNVVIADMLCQTLELAGYRARAHVGGVPWIDTALQAGDPPGQVLLGLGRLV